MKRNKTTLEWLVEMDSKLDEIEDDEAEYRSD